MFNTKLKTRITTCCKSATHYVYESTAALYHDSTSPVSIAELDMHNKDALQSCYTFSLKHGLQLPLQA